MELWQQALCSKLSEPFASWIWALPANAAQPAHEVRFRCGQRPVVCAPGAETPFGDPLTPPLMAKLLEGLTSHAMYAAEEQLASGFLALPGGLRAGVCARAVTEKGSIVSLRDIMSVCIRIAGEKPGCAGAVFTALFAGGKRPSVLVAAPPGGGKTTFLRDMVRLLSQNGTHVALCDERGEIAACSQGVPALDVGPRTDVYTDCSKQLALPLLLRCFSPGYIAVDELYGAQDAACLALAASGGVGVLATAHGTAQSLAKRSDMEALLPFFDACVFLENFAPRVVML